MLTGEALPSYSALAAHLLHTATGKSAGDRELKPLNDDGLFHADEGAAFYLLYKPDLKWLCGNEGALDIKRAKRIHAAASADGRKAVVFAPCKYMSQRDLTPLGITFCQIPYEMNGGAGAASG